jgi:macrodomain Ter protein organizer (MatP/YcbG family)
VNYLATVKDRSGNIIAQCEGSANTSEDKYKYTWLPATKPAESEINKMKAEKRGRRKKEYNGDYTRLEKKEADNRISLKNTIQKIAQKRAFVGAILMATGASEFYTQDVEDMNIGGNVVE